LPSIKNFQRQVERLEGFEVRVLHPDGRDVRDDMRIDVTYPYSRAAPGHITVAQWRRRRANTTLAGFSVEVLSPVGKPLHGGHLLESVRAMYR
jgi:hypothetical protein